MNQYELEQQLMTLGNNVFSLSELVKTNIFKEMWSLLPEENRKLLSIKVFESLTKNIPQFITGNVSYSDLFQVLNKEDMLKTSFADNEDLIENIKKQLLLRINELILKINIDDDYTKIIKNDIINKVKESYQSILSHHGDAILREAKALIVRVSSEQSILNYGAKLMQKAKQLVDEEIIKDLVE